MNIYKIEVKVKFDNLIHGKLIKRYKRFLADITLDDGTLITAHVPNSGAMTSCIEESCDVWVSHHDNPKRKLKYTLELTKIGNELICTNTGVANKIAIEAIQNGTINELQGYDNLKPEQKYGNQNSRIDILLWNENNDKKCFVEIKSVSLNLGDTLAFPDAKTTRGQKHLEELRDMVTEGHRAVMLYVIQRTDNLPFRIASEIDKKYDEIFKEVTNQGVEVLVYQSDINHQEIKISKKLDFIL
jgi:sugar fermentation stimulation protein A